MSNVFALLIFLYDENHAIVACFVGEGVLNCMIEYKCYFLPTREDNILPYDAYHS